MVLCIINTIKIEIKHLFSDEFIRSYCDSECKVEVSMGYYEYDEYDWIEASYQIDYYCEVVEKATKIGYSEKQVEVLIDDIRHHYNNGLSVDEVVDLIIGEEW